MKTLNERQVNAAARYNLKKQYNNRSPLWLVGFWAEHTPAGQSWSCTAGIEPAEIQDNKFAIELSNDGKQMVEKVIASTGGIQDFVYSDPGDSALGLVVSSATSSEMDGMYGTNTDRRVEAYLSSLKPLRSERPGGRSSDDRPWHERVCLEATDAILWGEELVTVPGVKIVRYDQPGGLPLLKGRRWRESDKRTHVAFLHWDVCFSSKKCHRVLKNRGLGSCFGIDNPSKTDGEVTIYQWGNPGTHRYAHGGTWPNKRCWTSFDYSLVVHTKYYDKYKRMTGTPRPVIWGSRNRGKSQMLGLYRSQIIAGLRLQKAIADHVGLPISYAKGERKGEPDFYPSMQKASKKAWSSSGDGVTVRTHLEYTAGKWDIAGYQEQLIALYFSDENFRQEFPELKEQFRLEESFWADWLDSTIKNGSKSWKWEELWG